MKSWPPRWLTVPPASDSLHRGDEAVEFIESMCRIVKDSIAGPVGASMVLRDWQRELVRSCLSERPDGRRRYRAALIGMPRKNGKSALLSGVALYELLLGADGGEVYSCAADKNQARIVFDTAKRMVSMDPVLAEQIKTYRDALEVRSTGSTYRVLSADAPTKEGLSPTFVAFDEVHAQPTRELWDVMALAMGARPDPMLFGITTAGVRVDRNGADTLCYDLYQHGKKVVAGEEVDPGLFFAWWEPALAEQADHASPAVWAESNPGYNDIVSAEDFTEVLVRTPESEFRTKRTNVFVSGVQAALPTGAWARLAAGERDCHEDEIVLAVDGSWSGDATGIVACTVPDDDETPPYLWRAGLWERPADDAGYGWRVPIAEVEETIRQMCLAYRVSAVVFDPFRWQRSMQVLEADGITVVEFTQHSSRMVPAWRRFYDAVLDGSIEHDGDPALARHLENMRLKLDERGARPVKDTRNSKRHIDLGVCAVMALKSSDLARLERVDVANSVW